MPAHLCPVKFLKIKKMKQLLLFFVFLATQTLAQTNALPFKKTIEIEVDPLAYLLNGYSVHGVYNHDHLRFDLGIFGIEQPAAVTGKKDFRVMTRGFGLKANYLIARVNGAYAGVDFGYAANEVTLKETGDRDTGHNLSAGVHVGYRFFLFPRRDNFLKGIYLTPWAGISYNHVYDRVKLGNYEEGNIGYFATFHLGYRF